MYSSPTSSPYAELGEFMSDKVASESLEQHDQAVRHFQASTTPSPTAQPGPGHHQRCSSTDSNHSMNSTTLLNKITTTQHTHKQPRPNPSAKQFATHAQARTPADNASSRNTKHCFTLLPHESAPLVSLSTYLPQIDPQFCGVRGQPISPKKTQSFTPKRKATRVRPIPTIHPHLNPLRIRASGDLHLPCAAFEATIEDGHFRDPRHGLPLSLSLSISLLLYIPLSHTKQKPTKKINKHPSTISSRARPPPPPPHRRRKKPRMSTPLTSPYASLPSFLTPESHLVHQQVREKAHIELELAVSSSSSSDSSSRRNSTSPPQAVNVGNSPPGLGLGQEEERKREIENALNWLREQQKRERERGK
ncbi:hypothetical protein T439DRAFT_345472 [Meredithblackwellia eburnea MCA 4105]